MTASPSPSRWTAAQVAGIGAQAGWALPVIGAGDVAPILPDQVVWDMWQLADQDGATVERDGRQLWFFLAAPRVDDPDARHDVARIRLTSRGDDGWRDHGALFPDGWTPGSREWSGSAVLDADGETVTLFFTAAGGKGRPRFEQRLFASRGRWNGSGDAPRIAGWTAPTEVVAPDARFYAPATQAAAVDDRIKGFRDPGWFRDPADGQDYILFTGSAAGTADVHDGVIGIARREGGRWVTLPPLLDATGNNSELERAHVVVRDGHYYLFWSTQAKRFSAAAADGVTGLYAMVADGMAGPWRPANGTGLVAGNPPAEPFQAYCWWVTGEGEVASFVDLYGLAGRQPGDPGADRGRHFGGAPAPFFRLAFDGDRVMIA